MSGLVISSSASLPRAFVEAPEIPTLCSDRRLQPLELLDPSCPLCTHVVRRKEKACQEKVLLRLGKGSDCFGGRRKNCSFLPLGNDFALAQPFPNGIRKPC